MLCRFQKTNQTSNPHTSNLTHIKNIYQTQSKPTLKASVDEAKECNITASKSNERGIERHAAIAACAAPINDEKENHPKFNIMFATHMKTVAFPLGKTGHNDPLSYVIARRTAKATRLINPSNAKSIVSGHCSLRHLDVMIAMREYWVVAAKHSMQPAIVFPAALNRNSPKVKSKQKTLLFVKRKKSGAQNQFLSACNVRLHGQSSSTQSDATAQERRRCRSFHRNDGFQNHRYNDIQIPHLKKQGKKWNKSSI